MKNGKRSLGGIPLVLAVLTFLICSRECVQAGDDLDTREVAGQEYDMSAARWVVREDIQYEGSPGEQFYGYVKKVLREGSYKLTPTNDEDNLNIGVVSAVRCAQVRHNGEPRTGFLRIVLGPYAQEITQVMVRLKRVQGSLHVQVLTRTGRRSGPGLVLRGAEDSGRGAEIASLVALNLINTEYRTVNPKLRFRPL